VVAIDVRPRTDKDRINPNGSQNIYVAILSANGFDAALIDPNTIHFGATETEAAFIHVGGRDVNGDGQRDLVLRFRVQDLGIECAATSVTLTGQLSNGQAITGLSPITTTGCKENRKRLLPSDIRPQSHRKDSERYTLGFIKRCSPELRFPCEIIRLCD
jgi:hypothetical protein